MHRCSGMMLTENMLVTFIMLTAVQIFDDMQAQGILADVVTCCSLINALERGGQWQLAEQLFVQMCAASWQRQGTNSPLYRMMEIAASAAATAADKCPQDPSGRHTQGPEAPQAWGSPYHHPSIESSPQAARYSSSPEGHNVQMSHDASPTQFSIGPKAQAGILQHQSPLLRTPPGRHSSDLQHQFSKLVGDHSIGNLESSLSTPDVTNFSTSLDRQHSNLSAIAGRWRDSEASLMSLQSQASPLKFAPVTPEKPSTLQRSTSGSYTQLVQEVASMHMQSPQRFNPTSPQRPVNMLPENQHSPYSTDASPLSHATAKKIQEAAAHRQDALSQRPTTNPVGLGQAPVLRFMSVTQIAPNRVCCNALLAAYARAKPTQWQKVSFLSPSMLSHNIVRPKSACTMSCFCIGIFFNKQPEHA